MLSALFIVLAGCENMGKRPTPEPVLEPEPRAVKVDLPSAAPIVSPAEEDVRFAQNTLNALGFKLGQVDGIWGPQSARSIREFERKYGLESANGLLSELNLTMLEKVSNTSRRPIVQARPRPAAGITAKLDASKPLEDAPQLIILDQAYAMLAKPNPFSETIAELQVGTGIYVIGLQEGWYEVEAEDQQRGFIQAD